jgi:hypothetical protein
MSPLRGSNLSNKSRLPKYRPSWPYCNEECENNDRIEVKNPRWRMTNSYFAVLLPLRVNTLVTEKIVFENVAPTGL